MQTDATSLANNSQLCWMLHVAYVCTNCCMLLDVVACCCAKFETVQTSSYVQTDAITPNNVESCWPAVLHPHPFAHGFRLRAKTDATTPNIVAPTMLGVVACVLAVAYKRMQQLPTILGPAVHRGKDTTHKSL